MDGENDGGKVDYENDGEKVDGENLRRESNNNK